MTHGRDPNNPWLLAHSLLAFGKDLRLANGQLAIDRIVQGFVIFEKIGDKEHPRFPIGDHASRIEPHPFMHVKTMLQLGVPLTHRFPLEGRTLTLADLLNGLIALFPPTLEGKSLADMAWAFDALYGNLPQNQWVWKNPKGEEIHFLRLLWQAMQYLDLETRFLRESQAKGEKVIQKKRQHIYAHYCGGFHFIQAMMRWMGHPAFKAQLAPFLRSQIDLVFYRLQGEMALYQGLLQQYRHHEPYRFLLYLQQSKFLGHALETLNAAYLRKLWTPSPAERAQIREALSHLFDTIEGTAKDGSYKNIEQIKTKSYQYYLDLLGDASHALHALRLLPPAFLQP